MQLSAIPPIKMPTAWAQGAASGFTRTPPNASQIGVVAGAASYVDGFVPLNFTPVAAGGVPPFGQDMNGALNQITSWLRWHQAGGTVPYDPTFQGAIGGYPARASVGSLTTPYLVWQSTVDNNRSNPDASGGGWQVPTFPDPNTALTGSPPAGGIVVTATGGVNSNGASIKLVGNGNVTPNKWVRAFNGNFAVVNNAGHEIFTLDDGSNITNIGNVTAAGAVNANTLGAFGNASVGGVLTIGGSDWVFAEDTSGPFVGAKRVFYDATIVPHWYSVWDLTIPSGGTQANGYRWVGPTTRGSANGEDTLFQVWPNGDIEAAGRVLGTNISLLADGLAALTDRIAALEAR